MTMIDPELVRYIYEQSAEGAARGSDIESRAERLCGSVDIRTKEAGNQATRHSHGVVSRICIVIIILSSNSSNDGQRRYQD